MVIMVCLCLVIIFLVHHCCTQFCSFSLGGFPSHLFKPEYFKILVYTKWKLSLLKCFINNTDQVYTLYKYVPLPSEIDEEWRKKVALKVKCVS